MVAVAPGQGQAWTVTLRNPMADDARCRLAVTGDDATWFWITQPDVVVPAGGTVAVRMGVKVPAAATSTTGRHPYAVEVRTSGPAGDIGSVQRYEAAVDVLAVVDIRASLGAGYTLSVRNEGNAPAHVRLDAGPAASLDPARMTVGPGDVATATVRPAGPPGTRFDVTVEPDGGAATVVSGTVLATRRGRRRWPAVVAVVVAGLVVAAALLVTRGGGSDTASSTVPSVRTDPAACPMTDHLASDANGRVRPGVATPVRYAFLEARAGGCEPVRFNPCEPVHYVVNAALAPPGGLADLEAAFAQLSAATGITFVNDGPTDEPPSINRVVYQPQRYGRRWAPILVVWAHGDPYRLDDKTPGGGQATEFDGVYVSGILILNIDAITDAGPNAPLPDGFGEGATWGRVMIHELAHLLGLGHVLSPGEIMFTQLGVQRGRAEYHAGDLEGLRILGARSGCLTPPPLP